MILQRKLLPSWQFKALRRASRRLVFDFDDAVMFRDSYSGRGAQSRSRSRRFAQTVCTADTIVAGNDFLADAALRAGARVERVHVIPTCVDPLLYPIARGEGPAELVWIGSSSTLQGLEQSRPIWQQVAEAIPGLKLRVICDRFPESFPLPVMPVNWNQQTEAREIARADRHELDSRRSLEPRQVRAESLAVPGGGLPVVANPVGCSPGDDSGRRDRISGDDRRGVGRGASEAGRRPTCGWRWVDGSPPGRGELLGLGVGRDLLSRDDRNSPSLVSRFLENRSSRRTDRGTQGVRAAPRRTGPTRTFNQIGDR